jgi:hypothetical protein
MSNQHLDRRQFLARAAILGASAASVGLLAACSKGGGGALTCLDTTGLSPADISTRTSLSYVDKSTDPAKHCSLCQLYTAAAPGACGGCTVVKGPIHPEGSCTAFVKKA